VPFLARCIFCGHQVQVPDSAFGGSGCCPKCTNFFTLAPDRETGAGDARRSQASPQTSLSAQASFWPSARGPAQCSEPRPAAEVSQLAKAHFRTLEEETRANSPWSEGLGLGALLLGGVALLCASAPSLCSFVVPLGLVGLLLGLAGLFAALAQGRFRLLLPIAGTAVAGVLVSTALLSPRFLGPVYRASRERIAADSTAIRVVPLPGCGVNSAPANPEWIDASQAALQQGGLQVQVLGAVVHPVKAQSSSTKRLQPGDYLCVRLRIQQVEAASAFADKRSGVPGPPLEKSRLRLTDDTGKVCGLRDVLDVAPVASDRKASVFPVLFQDEVFAFEAPPRGVKFVRLEVPVAAPGVLRFTIPASMIQREGTGPGGLAGGR
jgi:hypothetical protein